MKTIILIALVAYAYAAEIGVQQQQEQPNDQQPMPQVLPHVPKVTVTNIVQQVPVPNVEVPANVQTIVDHAHQHIPQVINHHISQHKQPQAQAEMAAEKKGPSRLPEQVQKIAQQAAQHIKQVVNHHIATQKKQAGQQQVPQVVAVPVVPQVVTPVVPQVVPSVPTPVVAQM